MANKEAINIISQLMLVKSGGNQKGIIKATRKLGQEEINLLKCVLDKIEEEINSPNRGTCDYYIVDRIEEIISKYRAESEGVEE